MDYRIFNVHIVIILNLMRAYIHTGVGHTDSESAQHFDSEKLPQIFLFIFLVLLTVFEPQGVWISSPTLYQLSQPRHPT